MAAEDRPADDPVKERLLEEGARFSFFQVVSLLEQFYRPAARVGRQGPASGEVIRFRPDPSLAFPGTDVVGVERIERSVGEMPRFRVTTTFLGLYGTTTPLPLFYSEAVLQREPEGDTARDFVDLFHHRLLSLFFRSWAKYRYHTLFEAEGKDEFSQRVFSLIGLGTTGLVDRTGLNSVRLLRYSGLLTQQPRSACALGGILRDFFGGLAVRIEQCTERWVSIRPEQRIALGRANCRLGVDASVGERVLGRMGSFRIVLGPMGYEMFLRLLPVGESFRLLSAIVSLFTTDRLDFDVELKVQRAEIPRLQLTSEGKARLGWSSWLSSEGADAATFRAVTLERSAAHA